ncbi:hypothetical protein QA612_20935 [Evansella sp. AB-P1]|uniref:hypothetical protein n=1 Tax=Evansella sp. AB-P1 TaxID=3037653 RepID=UPI00241F1C1B|nr:hypothetical protein [Evansella sp. AB-P1]MDG5789926.1 hypothetical protein [Evansella sp. AB-P1]
MKKYFINGHTSEGPYHLIDQFLEYCSISLVTGGSMYVRGEVLKETVKALEQEGERVVIFVHPNDGETYDSIFIPSKELLLLSDNEPLLPLSRFRGIVQQTYNLNDCLNLSSLRSDTANILRYSDEIKQNQHKAYLYFAKGREIHEEKEKIYLSAMDFSEADKVAEEIIEDLFSNVVAKENSPIERKLFFGAATGYGPVNFINTITEGLSKRIIIKGRSGSGKSTLMRKIVAEAKGHGLSVDYFPCALDPNSLDMVVIPSLSFAIIDGTAPHVINAERSSDSIVDMFERCINQDVEQNNMILLTEIEQNYKDKMKSGTNHLHRVNELEMKVHEMYEKYISEEKLSSIIQQIKVNILK